jgi:hypothetical protein
MFFLFILILEIILRTTHLFNARVSWNEPDEVYGWRFTPRATYWNRPPEGGFSSGTINSYGWRDVEWSMHKNEDMYRVAVVGDSYVEAFQVELSETFLKITENILSDLGYKAELMNFGRSGFTTTEELLIIRDEVLKFFPDLVVLFFYPPNDIRDVSKKLSPYKTISPFFFYDENTSKLCLDTSFNQSLDFRIRKIINPLKQNSAFISLMIERYHLLSQRRVKESDKKPSTIRGYLSLATSNPDPDYLQAFAMNKKLIKEISKIVRKKSAMMLVTLNSDGWKTPEEAFLKSIDASFNPFYFEDVLKELALAENIYYLGLQTEFRKDWEKHHRELHWGHWNYEGHKVVASILAAKIAQILHFSPHAKRGDRDQGFTEDGTD